MTDQVDSICLEAIRVCIGQIITRQELKDWLEEAGAGPQAIRNTRFDVLLDPIRRDMRLMLSTWFHGGLLDERIQRSAKWPATWWQAFKARWFPSWALRRWPVRCESLEVDEPRYKAVCPHLPGDDNTKDHIHWLMRGDAEPAQAAEVPSDAGTGGLIDPEDPRICPIEAALDRLWMALELNRGSSGIYRHSRRPYEERRLYDYLERQLLGHNFDREVLC